MFYRDIVAINHSAGTLYCSSADYVIDFHLWFCQRKRTYGTVHGSRNHDLLPQIFLRLGLGCALMKLVLDGVKLFGLKYFHHHEMRSIGSTHGTGLFPTSTSYQFIGCNFNGVGDFNKDSRADFLVANYDDTLTTHLNDGCTKH